MRVFVTLLILLVLSGCGDEKKQQNAPVEPLVTQKPNPIQNKPIQKQTPPQTHEAAPKEAKKPTMDRYEKEIFSIHDFSQDNSKAKKFVVYKEGIDFKNIPQKIVVLNFFSKNCQPCLGQFPYLSDLQNKYRDDLFLMGILLDSKMDQKELQAFATEKHALFFLADSEQNSRLVDTVAKQLNIKNLVLPLTVIYKEGNYYIHYEGAAPIEMIESDITQALDQSH